MKISKITLTLAMRTPEVRNFQPKDNETPDEARTRLARIIARKYKAIIDTD